MSGNSGNNDGGFKFYLQVSKIGPHLGPHGGLFHRGMRCLKNRDFRVTSENPWEPLGHCSLII